MPCFTALPTAPNRGRRYAGDFGPAVNDNRGKLTGSTKFKLTPATQSLPGRVRRSLKCIRPGNEPGQLGGPAAVGVCGGGRPDFWRRSPKFAVHPLQGPPVRKWLRARRRAKQFTRAPKRSLLPLQARGAAPDFWKRFPKFAVLRPCAHKKADCLGTESIFRRGNPGELKIEDRQELKIAHLRLAIFALPSRWVKISTI